MAKKEKDVGTKINKLRRVFIVGLIVAGIALVGTFGYIFFAKSAALLAVNSFLLATGLTVVVASGVGINKLHEISKIRSSKRAAGKALKRLRELDKDVSTTYSSKYRAKILRKFAKANLVLSRLQGASVFGELNTTSGVNNDEATELINQIDAYSILQNTTTSNRKQKKFSKKIQLLETRLSKIVEAEGDKTPKFKWAKSYDKVVTGASALDRRTEISCLTTFGRDKFQQAFAANESVTANSVNVYMHFSDGAKMLPSIARSEDSSQTEKIKTVLMTDLYEACKGKSAYEIACMFPVIIEAKYINPLSAKTIKRDTPFVIHNYSELESYVKSTTGREG